MQCGIYVWGCSQVVAQVEDGMWQGGLWCKTGIRPIHAQVGGKDEPAKRHNPRYDKWANRPLWHHKENDSECIQVAKHLQGRCDTWKGTAQAPFAKGGGWHGIYPAQLNGQTVGKPAHKHGKTLHFQEPRKIDWL